MKVPKRQLQNAILGFKPFGFESLEIFSNLIILVHDIFQ